MIVKTKIDMDLDHAGPVRNVYAVQGDTNTRVLELTLYVNKIPWQVPVNTVIQVRYGREDGTGGVYATLPDGSRAGEISGNTVSVTLAPQVLAQEGQIDVQAELIQGARSLATFAVQVHVEKNPALGTMSPPEYFDLRQWLMVQLESLDLPLGASAISIGAVSTLAPGENAWVSITRDGGKAILNLGIPAGYSPAKGVDYWTNAERQEIIDLVQRTLEEGFAEVAADLMQITPEFAQSTAECTDTGKVYVLPDGYLYAYMTKEVYLDPPELYDPAAATLNKRHSGTPPAIVAANGYVLTDFMQVDMTARDPVKLQITSDGLSTATNGPTPKFMKIAYYNSEKICLGTKFLYTDTSVNTGAKMEVKGDAATVFLGYSNTDRKESYYDQIAYVRIDLQTASTYASDFDRNLILSIVDPDNRGTELMTGWLNTGHSFVPADCEDRILTLEKITQEHSRKLYEYEEGQTVSIPPYWEDHLREKTAAIQALQEAGGKDCFSFAVLADIHENSNLGRCSGALARRLLDNCDIPYALILGDTMTRASLKTESDFLESIDRAEEILQPIRDRALQTRGNHDACWGDADGHYYLYDLPPGKLHSRIWRKVGMVPRVTADDTGTAFYADDSANRVRYILLNCHYLPYEEKEDGSSRYNSFRSARFGQEQFDWLIREALNVKVGWAIIVGTHVSLGDENDTYYGGANGDGAVLRGLLEAYNNRVSYVNSAPGTMGVDAVHVEADFSNAAGEVIAAMAGHSHTDTAGFWGVTVITTRCDGHEEKTQELKDQRVKGTVTEQSFDIFTVNRKTRTITATKIGAGEDRVILY